MAIGDLQQFHKEMPAALASYSAALDLFRAVGDRLGEANVLAQRAQIALLSDDQAGVEGLHGQALELYHAIGDRYSVAANGANFGWTLNNLGRREEARDSFRRAAEFFAAIGLEDRVEKYRKLAEEEPE